MVLRAAVYIMANKRNGTLYTGVTSNLIKRVYRHKTGFYPKSFTAKYGCNLLVYFQFFEGMDEAIIEEKRIKGGNRKSKLRLIETMNPEWRDLWEDIKE